MEIVMDVQPALKRLKWLVSKKGNDEDIDAFNSLLGWVNLYQNKQVQAYPIVAKLVINQFVLLANKEMGRTALDCVAIIEEMLRKPLTTWIETLRHEVPLIRFNMLYKDYQAELRQLKRIAEKNKIPASESELLRDEYQVDDLINIAQAKASIEEMKMKMYNVLGEEYDDEKARKFINDVVTKLMIINND